jgi:hypothetical protein
MSETNVVRGDVWWVSLDPTEGAEIKKPDAFILNIRLTSRTKSGEMWSRMIAPAFSLLNPAKRPILVSVVLLFGGLANTTLRAQTEALVGDAISVPLTAGTFEERSPNANLMHSASRVVQALREKPSDDIKSEPQFQNPTYYRLPLGEREVLAVLDVGKDAEMATLYIDFDGRGLFEEIQGIEGVDLYKDRTQKSPYARFKFGPITLPKTEGALAGPVEIMVSCHVIKKEARGVPYLQITPQTYVAGKLQLGSAEHTVAFVDGTCSGRFQPFEADPSPKEPAMVQVRSKGASMMAVDLDKNGNFDWRGEISPLVEMVRIDGKYFRVRVSPDGSHATFQEAKPELGILDTECPGMELFVVSDKCAALLTSNAEGKWELPVGKYTAHGFVLTRTEGDVRWTLDGANPSPAMQAIEVQPGTPAVIALGTPLVLNYSLDRVGRRSADTVSIGLDVTGKNGETYSAGAAKNRQRQPAPRFSIQSETGEKLAEGTFEYG